MSGPSSDGAASFAIIGAASLVGTPLCARLVGGGHRVVGYSRRPQPPMAGVEWRLPGQMAVEPVDCWISLAPVSVLPEWFGPIEASGARRLVQLSSTSLFTKAASPDAVEAAQARGRAEAEAALVAWAEQQGIAWTILRPTLIYGGGRDHNVSEIARFIARFGFFPLFGAAAGRRQPVRASDVAAACMAAASAEAAHNKAYNIAGAEVLTYRDMVGRIFAAQHRRPRFLPVPLTGFRVAVAMARLLPRYRDWNATMAARMNEDMVFDNRPAALDFGYRPQSFDPSFD